MIPRGKTRSPLIYLTEEPAQIDARRLNWALGV